MAKFYAVRNGYKVGIFDTWEECQKQVSGYSHAEYKSFQNRADAEKYLWGDAQMSLFEEDIPETSAAVAYTDGSYNIETQEFAYGVVLFYGGEEMHFSEKFSDPELASMRNVAGEIKGAERAMRYCVENGITELDLYYDYEGVEKWCTGEWKTNKDGTRAYKMFYDSIRGSLSVSFNKVKGHSGDKYNDEADALAKDALGIK